MVWSVIIDFRVDHMDSNQQESMVVDVCQRERSIRHNLLDYFILDVGCVPRISIFCAETMAIGWQKFIIFIHWTLAGSQNVAMVVSNK